MQQVLESLSRIEEDVSTLLNEWQGFTHILDNHESRITALEKARTWILLAGGVVFALILGGLL